jgi:N4-gp56 family major capsid protein
VQDWWSDRIDTALVNQLTGNTGQADTRYTGNNATTAPQYSATSGAGRWLFVNTNESTEGSISTTSTISLAAIDKAIYTAKTCTPVLRPIMVNGKPYYVMHMHPWQVKDLRAATTANGAWVDFQKALLQGGQRAEDNAIFNGALGVYNGCVLVENNRMPALTATSRRAVLCGAQAASLAVGQDNNPEKMSWVEELFDSMESATLQ